MELLVERHELLERLVVGPLTATAIVSLISRSEASAARRGSPLGGEAGGGALEHPAELDRVADVRLRRTRARRTRADLSSRTRPSCSSAASAKRTGVRETPRRSTRRSSDILSPGANSPRRISSRRRSTARVIWLLLARPANSHLTRGRPSMRRRRSLVRYRDCMQNRQSHPGTSSHSSLRVRRYCIQFCSPITIAPLAKPLGRVRTQSSRRRRSVRMFHHVPRVRLGLSTCGGPRSVFHGRLREQQEQQHQQRHFEHGGARVVQFHHQRRGEHVFGHLVVRAQARHCRHVARRSRWARSTPKQPGTDFTDIENMEGAYFACVNANGGVNGHPITADTS